MSDKPVSRGRGRPKGTGGNERKDMQVHVEPDANSRYIRNSLWVAGLPPIDISDAGQVTDRINLYFERCIEDGMKPSVTGCAMAIGVDRHTFNLWATGQYRGETHHAPVKKAREILTLLMEDYMLNGQINPVAGIFLMKNNHGYTDQQEVIVAPKDNYGDTTDPETLKDRYLEAAPPLDVVDEQ